MCLEIELGEDPEPGETEGNGGIGAEPPGGKHLRHLEQLTPLIPKLEVRSGFGTWRARGEALPSAACRPVLLLLLDLLLLLLLLLWLLLLLLLLLLEKGIL